LTPASIGIFVGKLAMARGGLFGSARQAMRVDPVAALRHE